jgi:hypothetical protein
MVCLGNLFTHYRYSFCDASITEHPDGRTWQIRTPNRTADLEVFVRHQTVPSPLPADTPFASERDARRYAGPLPYTFNYESRTNSIIRVLGVRKEWHPRSVSVEVRQSSFITSKPFGFVQPLLASAFELHDVPYRWQRGTRVSLEAR